MKKKSEAPPNEWSEKETSGEKAETKRGLRMPGMDDRKGVLTHVMKSDIIDIGDVAQREEDFPEEIEDAGKLDPQRSRVDAEEAKDRTRREKKS